MSLFSSLYTGVGGMNAQSKATGAISTNIANLTTVGYKKSETSFRDLVTNNMRPGHFANGGVMSTQINRIGNQGALQQAQTTTEMGINGQGFFVVKSSDDDALPYLYTRNGSFSPDSDGLLRNAAGFIVYGWPVDDQGNIQASATLDGLTPVDVNEFDADSRATTTATLAINLDAASGAANPQFLTGDLPVSEQSAWDPINKITIDNSAPASFSRSLTVYDDQGNARELTFEFRHITGPMAQTTSQASGLDFSTSLTDPAFFNLVAGDNLTVQGQDFIIGSGAGQVGTVGELINAVNTGGTGVDAMLDASGRILLRAEDVAANLTIGGTAANGANTLDFPGNVFSPLTDPSVADPAKNPNQADLPPFGDLADANTNGWWEMRVLKAPDSSLPDTDALYGQPVEISKGLINFDGSGQANFMRDGNGNITDGTLTVNPGIFDAGTGAALGDINIDMSGFTQYAGGNNVLTADQNGAAAGTLSGLDITTDGKVIARFTNDDQFTIYQIPLARFINPEGLNPLTGTVFAQTEGAGDISITAAGDDGAGLIQSSTLEQSNVDLGDEFAKLIVSQRAFQANSKVVNTVDEMTQQLRQLKN